MATSWRRRAAAAVLATAGFGVGACGGDDDTSSAGGETKDSPAPPGATLVVAKEFSFNPARVTLKAGQPVTIALQNTGSIEHDLTVRGADFKLKAGNGKTRSKELTIDTPGAYQFDCSLPGHKDAGMKGELTVE